jgi:hypothetical protein
MSGKPSSSTGGKARKAGAGSISTIELTPRLTKGLNNIAKLSGQPARKIALKAVEQYIEDLFDVIEVKRILARGEKTIPWEEVQRRCELLEG